MSLSPTNKAELIQSLQRQKDFKVEALFGGTLLEVSQRLKSLKPGTYSVIVIKS